MAVPVNIRANVRVPFPALIQATFPLTVAKANGIWTFNVDINQLASIIASELGGIPPNYRAVTVSPISIVSTPVDIIIGVDTVAINAAWTVNLPLSSSRGGFPLTFKDISGAARTFNGTFVPAGTDKIENVAASAVLMNTDRMSLRLQPVSQGTGAPGWIRL